jgi:hypothetical protein
MARVTAVDDAIGRLAPMLMLMLIDQHPTDQAANQQRSATGQQHGCYDDADAGSDRSHGNRRHNTKALTSTGLPQHGQKTQ